MKGFLKGNLKSRSKLKMILTRDLDLCMIKSMKENKRDHVRKHLLRCSLPFDKRIN